jgi:eukaryotic-like serine/threonine-protein kinase
MIETKEPAEDATSWAFGPGDEIMPACLAWDLLGEGRRCETWLAWSVVRWSPVTVKLPRPGMIQAARRGLEREARVGERLSHPSVQRLFEARLDGHPLPHLVFEYVEGPTLSMLLQEEGKLLPGDVVALGIQLASVLHYLHGEGLVHMDLKPGNVVVRDGRPIVLDFELARPIGEGGFGSKPRGTAQWMAPEQVRCSPAAPSMDLWALGAILYEAATGTRPYRVTGEGDDRNFPQLAGPPPAPTLVSADVPPALERIIMSLLERDPTDRPTSAAEALSMVAAMVPDGAGLWPDWARHLLASTRSGLRDGDLGRPRVFGQRPGRHPPGR